jgi:stearoyl-CoA desaturase (delta-9 desaturase)
MLGEGFHNNHHKYGARPNFGVKWFEFDPVYPFIWFFDKVGIVKLARQPAAI